MYISATLYLTYNGLPVWFRLQAFVLESIWILFFSCTFFLTGFVYILAKDYIEPYMQAVIQGNFSSLENVFGSAVRAGTLLIATLRRLLFHSHNSHCLTKYHKHFPGQQRSWPPICHVTLKLI